jgi:hypothetical protein
MAAGSTQRVYAEAFLAALAKRDYGAIASSLHPDVTFRALLPSRVAEHGGSEAAVDEIRGWFKEVTDFAMLGSSVDEVVDRTRIWFRIRLRDDDGWAVVEQTGFCDADGDGITSMNLVCSGWRDIDSPRGT